MSNRMIAVFVSGLLLAVTGCGGSKYQPVQGQIVFPDGSPVKGLDGGQIVFQSTGSDGKSVTATGAIDAEGKFRLGTELPGDGAVPGKHKVVVMPPAASGDVPLPVVIDKRYQQMETSGLEIEVKPEPNDIKVTVEPFRKK